MTHSAHHAYKHVYMLQHVPCEHVHATTHQLKKRCVNAAQRDQCQVCTTSTAAAKCYAAVRCAL